MQTSPAQNSSQPQPTWLSRVLRWSFWARTTALIGIGFLTTFTAVITADERQATSSLAPLPDLIASISVGLGYVAAFAAPVLLIWRMRSPFRTFLIAAVIALLTPTGPVVAGIALIHVLRVCARPLAVQCLALYGVAVGVFLTLDLRGDDPDTSFIRMIMAPVDPEPGASFAVSVPQFISLLLLLVGLPMAIGLYLRANRSLSKSQQQVETEQANREVISHEMYRQAERERIAREVHDAIGHRLSLLSLHAGGLELAAGDDQRLRDSAALVRHGAQEAMEDLRSLIGVLRAEPDAQADLGAGHGLEDLASVIDATADSGTQVTSTVYLRDAERADPALSRAAFRIVQEILTNARRHAAGAPVRLLVKGEPGQGLHIEAVNRTSEPIGKPGNGLTGIGERVEILGGTMTSGLDGDGVFRITVDLPWEPTDA